MHTATAWVAWERPARPLRRHGLHITFSHVICIVSHKLERWRGAGKTREHILFPISNPAGHKLVSAELRLAAAYSKPHHLHTLPRLTTSLEEGSRMAYTGLL